MNAPTEVAQLAPVVQPPATVASLSIKDAVLAQFKDAEVIVIGLADKYRDVAFDVATPKGLKEAIAARADLRDNGRLFVTKAETRIKADVNDLKRVMSSEVDRLVSIVKPVEDAVDAQIKAEEQRKAAEKAERDRIAAEKAAAHQAKIAKIRAAAENAKGISSERIKNGIAMVEGLAFGVECEDFLGQYEQAKEETLTSMRSSLAEAQAREAAEAQRLENERVAAELAAQRAALEAQAAEIRRQAEAVETARVSKVHGIVFTFPDPEEEARAQREAQQAEAKRIQAENDKAAAERTSLVQPDAVTEIPQAQQPQQVLKAEPAPVPADATDRGTAANESPRGGAMGAGQAAAAAPAGVEQIRQDIVKGVELAAGIPFAATAGEPSTLKLGAIGERLGFTLTEAFVSEVLGVKASGKDKRAVLYRESDFGRICDALVRHINKAKAGELLAA